MILSSTSTNGSVNLLTAFICFAVNKNGFVSKSAHQDLLIKKLSDKVVATKMAQEKQDGVLDDLIAMYDGPMKEIKKKGKLGEFLKMKKQAESMRKVSDENLVNVQMNFHHKWLVLVF